MGVHSRVSAQQADAQSLPALQNLIKRDPLGYEDEFRRRFRHFQSVLALQREQPSADSKDMVANVSFISHVSPCYKTVAAELPAQLAGLLDEQLDALDPNLRNALFQALVLLRNRGMFKTLELLQLCFRLFRCPDKALRSRVSGHVVADLKLVNLRHKDVALNRSLQNYVITMLSDASAAAAKHSLNIMMQMYKRGIWRDAKTVNVVAGALFCPHAKLRIAALHFLLGTHDTATTDADSDEEEVTSGKQARAEALRGALGRNGAITQCAARKKKRALKRANRSAGRSTRGKDKEEVNGAFAAIHLLHDPHTMGERLLSELRKSNERFEVRLLTINLISRLVGVHRLMLPGFYPYVMRYMQPHQRDVTAILAACVQASHELVPPDVLEPLIKTLVTHFISDKSRPEVITLGLNTVRELCVRVPLAMDATLLADLIEYRKEKDRGVVAAARGLLLLYRQRMPELLHKKLRGKGCDVSSKPAAYGALDVADGVEGADLLADFERIRRLKAQQAEIGSLRGAKRKRAEAAALAEDEEEVAALGGAAIEGEAVDEAAILGVQAKRNASREERLASTLAGREGRQKFGSRRAKKTGGGGLSNYEKRKNTPFMMARKSRGVRNKSKNREADKRKETRSAKKQFRGKVRK